MAFPVCTPVKDFSYISYFRYTATSPRMLGVEPYRFKGKNIVHLEYRSCRAEDVKSSCRPLIRSTAQDSSRKAGITRPIIRGAFLRIVQSPRRSSRRWPYKVSPDNEPHGKASSTASRKIRILSFWHCYHTTQSYFGSPSTQWGCEKASRTLPISNNNLSWCFHSPGLRGTRYRSFYRCDRVYREHRSFQNGTICIQLCGRILTVSAPVHFAFDPESTSDCAVVI